MINFKQCGTSGDYELYLGTLPTDIFWPTQAYKEMNLEEVNGLDMELEAMCEIADALCDLFPALKFDYDRTWLEISIALHAIRQPQEQLKVDDDDDAERYRWAVENAVIETADWRSDGKDSASTKQVIDNAIDAARKRT